VWRQLAIHKEREGTFYLHLQTLNSGHSTDLHKMLKNLKENLSDTRTDKYSESSIELAEHSNPETTKTAQGRNHNIPLNINSGY
jgi:hypothetical protein